MNCKLIGSCGYIWHWTWRIYSLTFLLNLRNVYRGREWTGEYLLDFKDLITSEKPEVASRSEEARFSFIKGGYVEDDCPQGIVHLDQYICHCVHEFCWHIEVRAPLMCYLLSSIFHVEALVVLHLSLSFFSKSYVFSDHFAPQKTRSTQKQHLHWLS